MIERIALSQGGRVTSVDPATNTIVTDFGNYTRRCRQRHPAAKGRPHRRDRRRRRPYRLVPDRSRHALPRNSCPIFMSSAMPASPAAFRNRPPPRNAQGKACAAAIVSLLSGKAPEPPRLTGACYNTVAPGYAFSLSGNLSAEGRHFRRGRGRRDQPGRCAARGPQARGRGCGDLVQDDHGGHLWLGQQSHMLGACARARWRAPCPAWQTSRPCGPMRSSATPFRLSLTGTPGDAARGRALVVDRSTHLHPLPQRPVSGSQVPGRSRPEPGRRRQPLVARASCGCGWSMPPASMPRRSCRPIIASTASIASGRPGAASRSCRRNKSRISWRIWQRCGNRKS